MFDLNAARIYVCVVEEHGFTAAADRLNIPKQTISRRIAELEEHLGVRLLERSTRKLRPTHAGEVFLNYAQQILFTAEQAQENIKESKLEPSGTLHIAASHLFCELTLQDIVLQYMQQYPKVNIELTLADSTLNLYDKNVDIGFVVGPIKDSSIIAKRMVPTWLKCFASPLFLETHGKPTHPSQLEDFPIIAYTEPIYGPSNLWHFEKGTPPRYEEFHATVQAHLATPSFWMARQSCLNGVGIARMPSTLCQYEVSQGFLVPLFPDWSVKIGNLMAIFPSRRMLSLPVRSFLDTMEATMQQMPPTYSIELLESGWSTTRFVAPHQHKTT